MIRSWDIISDKDVLNAAFLSKTDIETQNVAGPVNFTGSISILSGLSVGGDASFSGDVQISKELPVFTIKNTSGMDVAIVLDRSSNANWRILSTAGNLKIQSDYTTIKDVYYDILTLYYNTGNASLKGALTAAALSITGNATIAGSTTINGDTIISGAITANKITVLGLAASHPLRTRGIQGITEDGKATAALYLNYGTNHPVYINNETNIVWHAGNDGSNSGLDADLVDGKHYSDIINYVQTNLNIHANTSATISVSGHVKHAVLTANLDTTWSGTAPPYTKTVTVSGILSTDTPIIDVVMSGTYSTDTARAEAWGYIYRAVTADGSITFYATEKPTVSLPIQIKVVR